MCVSADLFVGGGFGKIRFLQNVGTKYRPEWRLNVTHNPLKHVDVGWLSAPTFGDFDKDGDMDVLIGQDKGPPGYVGNIKATMAVRTSGPAGFTAATRKERGFPELEPAFEKAAWKTEYGEEFPSDGATKYFRDALLDDDGKLWTDPGPEYTADLVYYKNTGSKTHPAFSHQTGRANNPMHGVQGRVPECVDLDGDGDVE